MSRRVSLRKAGAILLTLSVLLLAGCRPSLSPDQVETTGTRVLKAGTSLGQTFVAQKAGLSGVQVLMAAQEPGSGTLVFHLRSDPQASQDLAIVKAPLSTVSGRAYYTFDFPIRQDSLHQYYYAALEIQGEGQAQVFQASANAYPDGALYQDNTPQEAQMTFRLVYDQPSAMAGLLRQAILWTGILALGALLLALPGWALFSLFWPGWKQLSWGEKLGIAVGFSLAIYPVLILWTSLVGLRLGPLYAWLPLAAAVVIIGWQFWRRLRSSNLPLFSRLPGKASQFRLRPVDWALLAVLGLLFFTRFYAVRNLEAPLFGDSFQHTMIAQLIVDHGGLFNSWQPYTDLTTFTYHFGFHSFVACLYWISGIGLPQATLWAGQLLNIAAVLALYPLAVKIGKSQWAGIVALVVGGLLSPMPMAYTNWGRYTQLAGQVILPVALYLAWELMEAFPQTGLRKSLGGFALAWVALAGLALSHYRILIFAVFFFAAYFLFEARRKNWAALTGSLLILGSGAGLLFLPWFLHVFGGQIMHIFSAQVNTAVPTVSASMEGYNTVGDLFTYLPALIWLLIPLSLGWALWKQVKGAAIVGFWWLLVFLAANPAWLHLPGTGAIGNFTVLIAVYIPAGLLIGAAFGDIVEGVQYQIKKYLQVQALSQEGSPGKVWSRYLPRLAGAFQLALLALALAFGLWGARQRLADLDPLANALVTRPDLRAAAWIQANTPPGSLFLINSFPAFGSGVVGSDGGWWLPLLAKRRTTIPPLSYSFELASRPDYASWVAALPNRISQAGLQDPEVIALLKERQVAYIYIGQRQETANYSGERALQPEELLANPDLSLVYHQDQVWIFRVEQAAQ